MDFKLPPPSEDLKRATIKKAYDYFYYIDENRTGYKQVMNMNPNFKFLPDWVLNHSIHKSLYKEMMIIKNVAEKAFNDPASDHAITIKNKRNFY